MSRSRSASRSNVRRRPAPRRPASEQLGAGRGLRIGFVVLAMLVVCSMLAATVAFLPFDELLGLDDTDPAQNIVDPNDDLIEEQMATVEANPNDLDAVLLLANVLGNSGRLDEAIPYYERAIELAPDDPSVRLDFARSLADGGLQQDAELQFRQVLETDPQNQAALYYLAELYMEWEPAREEEAMELYERSIASDPDSLIGELARNRINSIASTPNASPAATLDAGD